MKITDLLISIPPYISTSWEHVTSLHSQEGNLIIGLKNGPAVVIPGLEQSVIEQVFHSHAAYLEAHPRKQTPSFSIEQLFTLPLKINLKKHDVQKGDLQKMDMFGSMLQHDPAHKDLPPIPEEIADKLSPLSEMIGEEDILGMPPSVADCNCMYCQIHRLLLKKFTHQGRLETTIHPDDHKLEAHDEPVSDNDLCFQEWNVVQVKDKLYTVTNKLDTHEQYTVYLGDPIGCTCGKPNCEHIIAVLRS